MYWISYILATLPLKEKKKRKSITSPFTSEEDEKPFAAAVLHPIGAVSLLLPLPPEQWPGLLGRGTALFLRDAPRESRAARGGAGKYRFLQYRHWNSIKPQENVTTPKPKQLGSALGAQAQRPSLALAPSPGQNRAQRGSPGGAPLRDRCLQSPGLCFHQKSLGAAKERKDSLNLP